MDSLTTNAAERLPAERLVPFNFRTDPKLREEPWTRLHELHAVPEMFFSTELGGHWCAVRREVIVEILRNHELFSNKQVSVPPFERAVPSIPHHLDPPEHGKYRLPVVALFGRPLLNQLEADIRDTARRLTKAMVPAKAADFVEEFALRMPVEIFMRLCGLPLERRGEFAGWVHSYFHGASPQESSEAHVNTVNFLTTWLNQSLDTGQADHSYLLASLLKTKIDDRSLSREEMLSILVTLFNGGLDTVAAQMSHILKYLAEHSALRERLIAQPALIPQAVEEFLRRFGIISIGRVVREDVQFRGLPLRRGEMVLCLISASGMDDAEFPNALEVDIDRSNRGRHCAFGSGPHMCVGAQLARLEIRIMLEELLPHLHNLRLAPGAQLSYYTGVTIGLHALPLEWDATPTSARC